MGTKDSCSNFGTFAHEMWEHRNAVLHNTQLESSREMRRQKSMMQLPSYMNRLIPIQQKTGGTLMFHWL